jgi:hypothetical protein
MTLEQLTEKLDTLNIAIASGVTEVTSGDKTIRYQSVAQMQMAAAHLQKLIAAASSTTSSRSIFVQHSRG